MKLNSVLLAGLVSVGLLTMGADSVSARGYFSRGNPGGLPAASGNRLAHTPANQAWEANNAWAHYKALGSQVQAGNVATGTLGSALQHNAVTP